MTEEELRAQFLRYQRAGVRRFKEEAECLTLARSWAKWFAAVDVDVCRDAVSLDLGEKWPGAMATVLARCREAMRAKREPEKRPEPMPAAEQRLHARACRIRIMNLAMSYEDALAKAREEVRDDA